MVDEKRRGAERIEEGERVSHWRGHSEQPERALEAYCHVLSYKVPFIRSVKVTWSELRHLGAGRLSKNVAFREKN